MENNEPDKAREKLETYDREIIHDLMKHQDSLFHQRLTAWIYAETIFFVVAAQIWQEKSLTIVIISLGLLTTVIFAISMIQLQLRVKWLIDQYKKLDKTFAAYLAIKDLDKKSIEPIRRFMAKKISENKWPILLSTGYLYSSGLTYLFLIAWGVILAIRIQH